MSDHWNLEQEASSRRRWIDGCLGGAAALGLAAILWWAAEMREMGAPLVNATARRGMAELQVAGDMAAARAILRSWKDAGAAARDNLRADETFIIVYAVGFLALGAFVLHGLRLGRRRLACGAAVLLFLCGAAAAFDHLENAQLGRLIGSEGLSSWMEPGEASAAGWAMLYAQVKWACLLVLLVGLAAGLAAMLRGWWLGRSASREPLKGDFKALCEREHRGDVELRAGPSGEPWVGFAAEDRAGLAFSGGGIRSATFNLGLLQALHAKKMLRLIDYLSTVSGGGYIGGWWTAWRNRPARGGASGEIPLGDDDQDAPEVRHLREFGNFLVPRSGFLESETWNAFVAVLGGMIPSLVVAIAVIACVLLVWLFLAFHVVWRAGAVAPIAMALTAAIVFIAAELAWRARGEGARDHWANRIYCVSGAAGLAAVLWLGRAYQTLLDGLHWDSRVWTPQGWTSLPSVGPSVGQDAPLGLWWDAIGASLFRASGIHVFLPLFNPSVVWLATALIFLAPRVVFSSFGSDPWKRSFVTGLDRVVQRLLAMSVAWLCFALVWVVGSNLQGIGTLLAGGGGAVSAALFAWLRNWIAEKPSSSKSRGLLEMLRPYTAMALAYVALSLLAALVVDAMVVALGPSWWAWYGAAAAVLSLLAAGLFLDLSEVGLHAFYRDRIVRAYLGASNPMTTDEVVGNRQSDPRPGDDVELRCLTRPPIHLICCAANDLAGDHLANLSRGSRSATLSRDGIAIGNHWAERPDLLMGPSLTASAAAVNSNMGSLSMSLGPAVTFLLSALNLRLGLWLRHPAFAGQTRRVLPGLLFLQEMLGLTLAGDGDHREPVSRDVHLSDGAHFENLALYELIRRHCRYIIVSDCGQDPGVAFDDLGNAVRRIREDFGVEIEIDLSALKPDAGGISRQHMAVGTIHYDGLRGGDKGILLYFKPTLTGDESADVLQYRERNGAFPHETTADQFYDEAQWESYRRLGEHSGYAALGFVERMRGLPDLTAESLASGMIFMAARQEWYPTPSQLNERALELTQRFNELQSEIRETAPAGFTREIFPELEEVYEPAPSPVDQWQEQSTKLSLLMKMMQLMEDVWFGCYLDTHFNHPLNLGWLNLFHRWAWTPTFRLWWPFLSPMYGSGFRRFALEQFDLGESTHRPAGRLQCAGASMPAGLAQRWWSTRMRSPLSTGEKLVFTYNLDLTPSRQEPMAIQVGVAFVEIREGVATWNSEELFVPPSLWGGGFGGSFLRELTNHLTGPGARCHPAVSRCRVELVSREGPGPDSRGTVQSARRRTDRGSRQQFVDLIEFYKSAGFDVVKAPTTSLTLEWTPGPPPGMGPGKPPGRHRFDSWEG